MSAEFEASLQEAWKNHFQQVTQPPMKDLLVAIAARTWMPDPSREAMNEVREYRNSLIHSGKKSAQVVPIQPVRSRMKYDLSWLPIDWSDFPLEKSPFHPKTRLKPSAKF
jgi:hypothetical protein